MSTQELEREARSRLDEAKGLLARHDDNKLTDREADRLMELDAELKLLMAAIGAGAGEPDYSKFGGRHPMSGIGESSPTEIKADQVDLAAKQRVSDWQQAKGWPHPEERELSLGKFVKGFLTGDWTGANKERDAYSKNITGGVNLIPLPLSVELLDLVRDAARVVQAGARTIPMSTATLRIARQTGDPSATWHEEGVADIADSSLTFDAVELSAKTLATRVKLSRELFDDASGAGGLDRAIGNAIRVALGLELDRVALQGDSSVDPQEPDGLRNTSGIDVVTFNPPNGGVPDDYSFISNAIFDVAERNHEPNAAIDAVRTERTLDQLTAGDGQPLQPSPAVESLQRLSTNAVPTDFTVGTSNDASEVYVGNWNELLIGMRTQLGLQVLDERFKPDSLEVEFLAWMRADIAVARPDAFQVVEGIRA